MEKEIKKNSLHKPWNRVYEQIYSVVTHDEAGRINANIATYVVPVTMQPKCYMIAVYRGTQTHKNIFEPIPQINKKIILHMLSKEQTSLINILGRKSGLRYDKHAYLEKKKLLTSNYFPLPYLLDTACTLVLEVQKTYIVGDHDIVIAHCTKVLENNPDKKLLTTNDLETKGLFL